MKPSPKHNYSECPSFPEVKNSKGVANLEAINLVATITGNRAGATVLMVTRVHSPVTWCH